MPFPHITPYSYFLRLLQPTTDENHKTSLAGSAPYGSFRTLSIRVVRFFGRESLRCREHEDAKGTDSDGPKSTAERNFSIFRVGEGRVGKAKGAGQGEGGREGGGKDQSSLDGKPTTMFMYNFVNEVLSVVLQTSKPATGNVPYSSDIVKHLLEQKVVSGSIIDGGLLRVLRMRNDWKSIFLALTNVEDLEEVEIIECLCFILARHRQRQTQRTVSVSGSSAVATDAMQVDGPPTSGLGDLTPTLPVFLGAVLRYTHVRSSTVSLRAAFRRYLSDVDSVVCLSEVLDGAVGWEGYKVIADD
ncbi:hypothetical protein D9757_012599 [Collybiopsis confluens]|uniref:Uncharacterized protein n=1 Tax=Collybiopsis confluens TaxID=2823264 RepID=A0A8H5LPG9_9AGAR|nr:hypothetical protein D9757_012599 [Collybiopsis confluens]